MGCLVQIVFKEVGIDDDREVVSRIFARYGAIFGKKIDIVSESESDGKLEMKIYLPWDEDKTSEKLMKLRKDKQIRRARIIC